jgi:membrane protein DedA with SNARE-associated domain
MPRTAGRAALIIAAALCVPLLPFLAIGELPGERWLSANDGSALRFALIGAGLLAADTLLPIPSSIVGTLLGARLGFAAGFAAAFAAAFAGMMAGQSAAYLVSRWVLRKRSGALPAAPTLAAVFLSRPVPVLAEAVAFAAGAAHLSWPQFLLACGAGNLVYAAALTLNGARLLPGDLIGPGLLLPMLLPVAAWLIWRKAVPHAPPGA